MMGPRSLGFAGDHSAPVSGGVYAPGLVACSERYGCWWTFGDAHKARQ